MNSEEAVIEYELARNDAMDAWFEARPNVTRSEVAEMVFEGGFRLGWTNGRLTTHQQKPTVRRE